MKFLIWTYILLPITTVLGLPAPKVGTDEPDVQVKDPYVPRDPRKRDADTYVEREAAPNAYGDSLRRREPGIDIEVERDVPNNHEESFTRRETTGGDTEGYCTVM